MHGGQEYAQGDDGKDDLVEFLAEILEAEFLDKGRGELQPENEDIGTDTHRHLEHDRVKVHLPREVEVVDVEIPADIEENGHTGQGIAEHRGQQGRTDQRMVFALVDDIDHQRHDVATAGKGGADNNVVGDPDAPGVAIVHVGDGTDTKNKTLEGKVAGYCDNKQAKTKHGRKDTSAQWLRFMTHGSLLDQARMPFFRPLHHFYSSSP